MKKLKKYLALFLAICLTFSLFCASACNEEEQTQYYRYDCVDIEMDIEIPDDSEEKDFAEPIEYLTNLALVGVENELNEMFKENLIEVNKEKLIWYANNDVFEYTFSTSFGKKTNIAEMDMTTKEMLRDILDVQGASIDQGITAYVEREGDTLELSIEIYASQKITETVYMKVEYDFEYKFNKTVKPPVTQE